MAKVPDIENVICVTVQEESKMAVRDKYPFYLNSEMCEAINQYIHSERDRAILKRRLVDGICFEPLAEEFELSTAQVKNIVRKYEHLIFNRLDKNLQ